MENDKEWTYKEKLVARVISWGIIFSVLVVIVGSIWIGMELIFSVSEPSMSWFFDLALSYQILVIGGLIVAIIIGIILVTVFVRKGQKFILNLLFKIED